MLDFQFQVPTKVFFGEGAEKEVGRCVREFGGHRVLIHFGSRHSKQSGLIDRIAGYLNAEGIEVVELGGVQPNPRLCEACMKTLVHNGWIVMEHPEDLAARSQIMWAASLAQAGLLNTGRQGDWASHDIENELSAVYDVAHGAGLAVVFPSWMKYVCEADLKVFVRFATRVWNLDPSQFSDDKALALEGIERLSGFFIELGLPSTLVGLNIPTDQLDMLAERAAGSEGTGQFMRLSKIDVHNILKICVGQG